MTADAPSTALIVGTFFLGLLSALFWPVTRHVITAAHEGSHAIFGSLTGGKIESIKMRANSEGETLCAGGNPLIIGVMGYIGPPVFGILGATMLANRISPDVVLWVSFALLVVVFFQIRNLFGWSAILVGGFLLFMIGRYGTPGGRTLFAYTWVWFLLLGGVVSTALTNVRPNWSGDAKVLREQTKLSVGPWNVYLFPAGFWGLLFWLGTLACFVYGAGILLGFVDVKPDGI
jgi:hypothetical protein